MNKIDLTKSLFVAMLFASPFAGAESKYPAADFEPGVVYKDEKLIEEHSSEAAKERAKPAPASQSKAESKSAPTNSESASSAKPQSMESVNSAPKDSSVGNLPIALVVLAIGGFAFWSSRKGAIPKPAAPATTPSTSSGVKDETGVERYLKSVTGAQEVAETGVSRYLKGVANVQVAETAQTGVAKYLKNLPEVAPAAETGVSRYLKNVK